MSKITNINMVSLVDHAEKLVETLEEQQIFLRQHWRQFAVKEIQKMIQEAKKFKKFQVSLKHNDWMQEKTRIQTLLGLKDENEEDMISSMRAELKVLLETFYKSGIITHGRDVHAIIEKFLNKENLIIEIDWVDY